MDIITELQGLEPSGRTRNLLRVAIGSYDPPNYTRLGAFEATLGFQRGTVGHGANRAIAGIYIAMGDFGEDHIGTLFHSQQVQALLDDPADGPSSRRMAELEYAYWNGQDTIGGWMGRQFSPSVRDAIQWAFSRGL